MKGLKPIPLFLLLLVRILDIFTTRIALMNPLNYEGMFLGNNLWLALLFPLFPMLVFQWHCGRENLNDVNAGGTWGILLICLIPVLNNLTKI